jgi:hypothetical protein
MVFILTYLFNLMVFILIFAKFEGVLSDTEKAVVENGSSQTSKVVNSPDSRSLDSDKFF